MAAMALLTIVAMIAYIFFRFFIFSNPGYRPIDRFFAFVLLSCELFFCAHGINYSLSCLRSILYWDKFNSEYYFLDSIKPKVAVFICAFNEGPETLEGTISSASLMSYENKEIYLLDDSTIPELKRSSRALSEKYGIRYVSRENRRGFKAGAINDAVSNLDAKYVMILDSDQCPSYNFLDEIVPIMEGDPNLAFVQTPQYYSNRFSNKVARAAYYVQHIFYTYICEGKAVTNSMFACGTNMVINVRALKDIGGFDESSVTEDFATSFKFHCKKYRSYFYPRVMVEGEGPESIPAYYSQQMRWSYGTIYLVKQFIKELISNPRSLSPVQWWEYLIAGTWYISGWSFFLMTICPSAYLIFGVRPIIFTSIWTYVSFYLPFFLMSFINYVYSLIRRDVPPKEILKLTALTITVIPIYMLASVYAIVGKKMPFKVTPKGGSSDTELKYFYPQILMVVVFAFSVAVGLIKMNGQFDVAIAVNIFWCLFNMVSFLAFIYFLKVSESEGTPSPKIDVFDEYTIIPLS
jgi:cellulose synthase (UDP-forming)